MKVIIFGATGMVGQGVLRECLLDPEIEGVLTVGRRATGRNDPKLRELVLDDLHDYSAVTDKLAGYDACYFCLGIASAGMKEEDYRRITRDIPAAAGAALAALNPNLTFILVSGRSTDSSEKGSVMWARVKGAAENAIFALPCKGKYAFRPGLIQPLHGIKSRTTLYRVMYVIFSPLVPLLRALYPNSVSTTEQIGRAMLNVTRRGYPKQILETADIEAAANLDRA
jgi:uncharacterized protein YbjT (DUF2867 family)